MISGATTCFPNATQGQQMYRVSDDVVSSSVGSDSHSNSLLYSLSLLKERLQQVQSLVTILVSPAAATQPAAAVAIASMGTLVQEIIITSSSMMFTCQQMALVSSNPPTAAATTTTDESLNRGVKLPEGRGASVIQPSEKGQGQSFYASETIDNWYEDNYNTTDSNINEVAKDEEGLSPKSYDIIELEAADLLAKYTHYCQVCGKGFKRDANLRMHMRAHGDEYKSSAALINPMKNMLNNGSEVGAAMKLPRKYSCPQEGCRWNRKHEKFQPLKSMICVKNHYKRTHCPKMYVCKRCNRKQFSVLSDLRTHEKHCGDLRWQCSCGTTFSRKDKLMGHVALFVGHTPAVKSLVKMGNLVDCDQVQVRIDIR